MTPQVASGTVEHDGETMERRLWKSGGREYVRAFSSGKTMKKGVDPINQSMGIKT
jgi:hypothetical protein